MERKKIKESIVMWQGSMLNGKLEEAISTLQKIIKDHSNHFDFSIEFKIEQEYYGDYDSIINIDAWRMETDDELQKRVIASRSRYFDGRRETKKNHEQRDI